MAPPPGPYSGTSTLALVARASAFTVGLVYGSVKLRVLKQFNAVALGFKNASTFIQRFAYRAFYTYVFLLKTRANSHKKAEAKAKH